MEITHKQFMQILAIVDQDIEKADKICDAVA
jgi:hypothetical protein